jgi:cystathionine beta-lyase family protein involved in aluminum resistance
LKILRLIHNSSFDTIDILFLKNAVLRRNQIVHQGDYDGFSVDRQEIFVEDTKDVIVFIEDLGKAIFTCVNSVYGSGRRNIL